LFQNRSNPSAGHLPHRVADSDDVDVDQVRLADLEILVGNVVTLTTETTPSTVNDLLCIRWFRRVKSSR
jgi:hypothetical protein